MKKISVIVPCFNEEKSLPGFWQALSKEISLLDNYDWEILFIDDGSTDTTLDILKELRRNDNRVRWIQLSRNFGKEAAMLAGFDHAAGDAAVIMDADLQHPPSTLSRLLEEWRNGYDDVYARRRSRGREGWLRRRLSLAYYRLLTHSTRLDVLPNVGDFRLLDRRCLNALKELRETERYTKGLYSWIGFKKKDVEFDQGDREAGKTSWNYWRLFKLAVTGITSYTTAPLRMATIMGLIVSFVAFAYMLFILIRTLIYGDVVRGFPTLIIVILFLGGIQLIALGIIGEYVARIFNETKNRPVYFIRDHE